MSSQLVPDARALTASNCSGPSSTTTPRSLTGYYTVRVAPGWTDAGDYGRSEVVLLALTAPQGAGFAPTRIEFANELGPLRLSYPPNATAHSIAQQHADSIASDTGSQQAIAGAVSDCVVGGAPAAAFGYSDGATTGFRVYVVHGDYANDVWLSASGGVSSQAIQDALGMIGSLTYPMVPVPDVSLFTYPTCAGTVAAGAPQLLGYFTIRSAPNWTDTGNYQHTETILLQLTAPLAYGSTSTTIQFHSDLGPVDTVYGPGATAHYIAQQHADSLARDTSPVAMAGPVRDCNVGGEPAAAFGYSDGTQAGYRLYFIHGGLLFEVFLFGAGRLDNQAIRDSLGMIGSLTWAF